MLEGGTHSISFQVSVLYLDAKHGFGGYFFKEGSCFPILLPREGKGRDLLAPHFCFLLSPLMVKHSSLYCLTTRKKILSGLPSMLLDPKEQDLIQSSELKNILDAPPCQVLPLPYRGGGESPPFPASQNIFCLGA